MASQEDAFSTGNKVLNSDYITLRNRVIAEFNTTNRRNVGTNYTAPLSVNRRFDSCQ